MLDFVSSILVAVPIRPSLPAALSQLARELAWAMVPANPDHALTLHFDFEPIERVPGETTPWAKVARVRNRMLDRVDFRRWDYVLWIDADVMAYPHDMPTRLIAANPEGITSPLVFIEGSEILYDWAACIYKGKDGIEPDNREYLPGRNIATLPPYWLESDVAEFVEMDCVGTVTMVPAKLYNWIRYEDHPAFTDHYSICRAARSCGRKVGILRTCTALHADLPKYGEPFHE